jgi:hypothetical protein
MNAGARRPFLRPARTSHMDAFTDLPLLGRLLAPPGADYHGVLERARADAAPRHREAARHLGVCADRLRDLAPDELEELYRETFGPDERAALATAAQRLATGGPPTTLEALSVLEPMLPRLTADRNPLSPLFKAIICLLLAAVPAGGSAPLRRASRAEPQW